MSSDATLRNYSQCPDRFVVNTDVKGVYYVYYFFFYSKSEDHFNISYSVVQENFTSSERNWEIKDKCGESSFSKECTESRDSSGNNNTLHTYEEDPVFRNRFMHAVIQVESVIYVHGGLSSRNISDSVFIRFSNNRWESVPVYSTNTPPCLYSHTLSYYSLRNELILYGGIECGSKSTYNEIVWILTIYGGIWQPFTSQSMKHTMGHSSLIYKDIMYSFFGLTQSQNSETRLLSSIQRFNLTSRRWIKEVPLSNRISNIGLIYHCSVRFGDQVWIFGGLYQSLATKIAVSSRLYSFNLSNYKWSLLSNLGPSLYLHACVAINDTLITVGGLRLDEGNIEYRYRVGFSQSLSSELYYFNQDYISWRTTSVNYTNMCHGVLAARNNVLIIIGGKATGFHSPVTYIKQETCNGFPPERAASCQRFTKNNLDQELPLILKTTNHCNYTYCDMCTHHGCVWCPLTQLCVSKLQFAITFSVGGCEVPILYESKCPIKCEHLSNTGCTNCVKLTFCGWCEFRTTMDVSRHLSGIGKCVEGSLDGPSKTINDSKVNWYCRQHNTLNNWYYLSSKCPSCNCNGHASCLSPRNSNQLRYSKDMTPIIDQQCSKCQHNTAGNNCQDCKEGHQGQALNGQKCTQCKCVRDKFAGNCNINGLCDEFCVEKGRIGNYCEDCDMQNNFTHYRDMCVFRAKINFQYILDKRTDLFNRYTNRVNFLLSDVIPNMDLHFKIRCLHSHESLIRVELFNETGHKHTLINDKQCLGFETLFPKSLFKGFSTFQLLFQVSGFENASWDQFQLEVIFTQKTYINLPYIFISFFACLSISVLAFYAVFKLRQHINRRTQAYRTLFVMERPFAKLQLAVNNNTEHGEMETTNTPIASSSLTINRNSTKVELGNSRIPMICVEPFRTNDSDDGRAMNTTTVIVSVLFSSPLCSNSGLTVPRILIGSTVTKISKLDRKMLLELPTKSSSGTSIMVDRDFDTSVSPSAAEELLTTEV